MSHKISKSRALKYLLEEDCVFALPAAQSYLLMCFFLLLQMQQQLKLQIFTSDSNHLQIISKYSMYLKSP